MRLRLRGNMKTNQKGSKSGAAEEAGRVSFMLGFWHASPLIVAVIPFALLVGTLAQRAGLNHGELFLMSTTVFAGAAQFSALEMWASPLPILAIIGVAGMVNLRFLIMGAALAPKVAHIPFWYRWGFVLFLVDENWALAMRQADLKPLTGPYLFGVTLPLFLNWQFWGLVGVSFGSFIDDPKAYGFDFMFTAIFIALLMGFYKGGQKLAPMAVSAAVSLLAFWTLPGLWYIFTGSVAGIITGALLTREGEPS